MMGVDQRTWQRWRREHRGEEVKSKAGDDLIERAWRQAMAISKERAKNAGGRESATDCGREK